MPNGIFSALGFPFWPSSMAMGREDCTGTADGGKPSRLDRMIDDDGPLPKANDYDAQRRSAYATRLRDRMKWEVTEETRLGGTGLYRGTKE